MKSNNFLYITFDEKKVLFKKLIKSGYDYESAQNRINKICNDMSELAKRLRKSKKSEKDINRIFKEEFSRLCEKY